MPYLIAMLAVIAFGVKLLFSYDNSEKYENSIIESQWATVDKSRIISPQIIRVKNTREYIVLVESYNNDVIFTLLNPEDGKSIRTFPENDYRPSMAAVMLAESNLQVSAEVVKKLKARVQ